MKAAILAAVLTGMTAAVAQAQTASADSAPIEFRVVASPDNISGCRGLDGTFSRVNTITLQGDKALLKIAGGITETLKQTAPHVYTTVITMNGVRLDVVADASKSPKTLVMTDKNRGCRWDGTPK